jgi:ribokinase
MTVVVVGSANVDLVLGLHRMPDPGETVFGHSLERFPGGKGLNQAVAAARAGASVSMVAAVGSDEAGAWLRGLVVAEGIQDEQIRNAPGPSGTAVIEVDQSGMNRIVVIPGANAAVDAAQVERALAAIEQVAVVLVQHEVPPDAVRAAMRGGRARGALTILNPAPARELDPDVLADVDLLVPNEHEAALLTGLPTGTADQALAAAAQLRHQGPGAVVVTRGSEGVVWCDADGTSTAVAFSVQAVDTVAAGDAFCGCLAAALAEGRDLGEAIRLGSAAGALAASAVGAVPSLPNRAAIDALATR